MKLIDVEEAKRFLDEHLILPEKSYETIAKTMLDAVPIAYDVDKVMEQLEEKRDIFYAEMEKEGASEDFFSEHIFKEYYNQCKAYNEALKIVKSGYRNTVSEMTKETK